MKSPTSLEAFLDWCLRQPREKRYNYADTSTKPGCAVMQYLVQAGFHSHSYSLMWRADRVAITTPHTFGALAERVQMAIEREKETVSAE